MTRSRLPDRRAQETVDIEHDGQRYSLSLGFYGDGRPGEAFIQAHKLASAVEATARDSAILISLWVQHGHSLDEVRNGLTRDGQGRPASIIGAAVDAIAGVAGARLEAAE